jgi:3-methyladenine DNA glycosylase AlkD
MGGGGREQVVRERAFHTRRLSRASSPLARDIRTRLAAASNPEKAAGMQTYMKSAMPYRGVNLPQVRSICKETLTERPVATCREWQAVIVELWRAARYREERYAALELLGARKHRECWTPALMPMLEEMITTGAWWDLVDGTAHAVGQLLRAYPKQIAPIMRAWSTDENLWKRRVSIICQVSFKKDTDLDLLYANIEPNLGDRDFFIRKAIGWSLRAYAWTDPREISRYVHANEARLSGLSRREALKNIS